MPAFVTKGGEPWLVFGVMGGDMQPQGHVEVLCNLIDFGMDVQAAGEAPRLEHVGSATPTGKPMAADGGNREGGTRHPGFGRGGIESSAAITSSGCRSMAAVTRRSGSTRLGCAARRLRSPQGRVRRRLLTAAR